MTVRSGAGRTTVARVMSRNDVLAVLALLREAGADVVIAGGRGIDALLGERPASTATSTCRTSGSRSPRSWRPWRRPDTPRP